MSPGCGTKIRRPPFFAAVVMAAAVAIPACSHSSSSALLPVDLPDLSGMAPPVQVPTAGAPEKVMALVPTLHGVLGSSLEACAAATGTYCLNIPKLVALRLGSVAMAARPSAVGVSTWPPAVAVRDMSWRSKLVKKNSLFLIIGPPSVPP